MKNKGLKLLLLAVLLLLPFSALQAKGGRAEENVYVAKDEIISGNFYVAGANITIDGSIGGDLIVVGQTISVNGLVEGDIIAAGQNITVNGAVGGNIRAAGNSLTINGSVARNVNAFGATVVFGPQSRVGWDAYAAGASLEARGVIDGSLGGYAGQAIIAGQIGQGVNLNLDGSGARLTIAPTAVIKGDLSYVAKDAADISERSSISGRTEHKLPAVREINWLMAWLWSQLFSVFAALLVGLALVFGLKDATAGVLAKLEKAPQQALLPGLVLMLVVPPIAIILAFTLIGIPLALIIMALWLIFIYLAKIIAALWLGRLVAGRLSKKAWPLAWSLVLGVIVLWFLFAIPVIGWLLCLFAAWLGLGAIWSYARSQS